MHPSDDFAQHQNIMSKIPILTQVSVVQPISPKHICPCVEIPLTYVPRTLLLKTWTVGGGDSSVVVKKYRWYFGQKYKCPVVCAVI